MTNDGFEQLAAALARENKLTLEEAERFVAMVGDKPEEAPDGRVIVRDDTGREVTRLFWPYDE